MAAADGNPIPDTKSPEELCIGYTLSCVQAPYGDCLRFTPADTLHKYKIYFYNITDCFCKPGNVKNQTKTNTFTRLHFYLIFYTSLTFISSSNVSAKAPQSGIAIDFLNILMRSVVKQKKNSDSKSCYTGNQKRMLSFSGKHCSEFLEIVHY